MSTVCHLVIKHIPNTTMDSLLPWQHSNSITPVIEYHSNDTMYVSLYSTPFKTYVHSMSSKDIKHVS